MTIRFERYGWKGGEETLLRFGSIDGPTVLAALPLFEEANRTRAALVDVLRRLAALGIGSALPDLPGTGESLIPTEAATLADWQNALAAAAEQLPPPVRIVAWRGGALVAANIVAPQWHLSPLTGAEVVRDLRRARAAGDGKSFAGNLLSAALIDALQKSEPAPPSRTVRLDSDPRNADRKLPGRPLWRAAEPGTDPALQAAIAKDIATWAAACAG